MLSYHQAETAAYMTDGGGFYHPDCAREVFGTLSVEKADIGLTNAYNLSPLSRYGLDEYVGEASYDYLTQEREDDGSTEFQDAWDALAETWVTCEHCGEAIS